MNNITDPVPSVTPASVIAEADQALLDALRQRWPILNEAKPLKIGTRQDIRAALEGVSGVRISRAVLLHIATPEYQAALAAGGARYALDGSPAGEVTAKEQRHAQAILDGKLSFPTTKSRKKPKRLKAKHKAQPSDPRPQSQAEAPPPNIPTAAPPEPATPPVEASSALAGGRPILKLKPKAGTVTTATVTRKEPKP